MTGGDTKLDRWLAENIMHRYWKDGLIRESFTPTTDPRDMLLCLEEVRQQAGVRIDCYPNSYVVTIHHTQEGYGRHESLPMAVCMAIREAGGLGEEE